MALQRLWVVLKDAFREAERDKYECIFYSKFGHLYKVDQISERLREDFTFVRVLVPVRKTFLSTIRPSELWSCVPEVLFKADTLYAAVSPSRAILYQKTRSPFTEKDVALRQIISELYSFQIKMPLLSREPTYETEASS